MATEKLNGSVDLLAQAMRDVFTEAMTSVRNGVKADMDAMEKRLDERINTTDENVQAQLAQHRKNISEDFEKALQGSRT